MYLVEVCRSVDMAERRIPSWGTQVLINEIPPPTVLFNQRTGNLALIPSACNVTCSPCLVQPEPLTSTRCAEPIRLSPFSLATFTAASALMKAHLSSATPVPCTPPAYPLLRLISEAVSSPRTAIFKHPTAINRQTLLIGLLGNFYKPGFKWCWGPDSWQEPLTLTHEGRGKILHKTYGWDDCRGRGAPATLMER